jgi:hypothetical protein
VLAGIAAAQSSFDVKGEAQEDGGYKITSSPAITAFSDNMVVSYPAEPLGDRQNPAWDLIASGWSQLVRQQMQRITAQVVRVGLDVGLLVRGGITRGKLFHQNGVVVGPAMVEAYRLERCVARRARVAVSQVIQGNEGIFVDDDAVRCLDFFTDLMIAAGDVHGDELAWARTKRAEIDGTIQMLTTNGRLGKRRSGEILEIGFGAESEILGLAEPTSSLRKAKAPDGQSDACFATRT